MECCRWTHNQKLNNVTNTLVFRFSLKYATLSSCLRNLHLHVTSLFARTLQRPYFSCNIMLLVCGESVCLRVQSDFLCAWCRGFCCPVSLKLFHLSSFNFTFAWQSPKPVRPTHTEKLRVEKSPLFLFASLHFVPYLFPYNCAYFCRGLWL